MVEDLTRARNRLTKFLLRHAMVWRGGSNWTDKHHRWLAGLRFDDRALALTFAQYRATVQVRDAGLVSVEADLRHARRTSVRRSDLRLQERRHA
jgi:hypothetical protein